MLDQTTCEEAKVTNESQDLAGDKRAVKTHESDTRKVDVMKPSVHKPDPMEVLDAYSGLNLPSSPVQTRQPFRFKAANHSVLAEATHSDPIKASDSSSKPPLR